MKKHARARAAACCACCCECCDADHFDARSMSLLYIMFSELVAGTFAVLWGFSALKYATRHNPGHICQTPVNSMVLPVCLSRIGLVRWRIAERA